MGQGPRKLGEESGDGAPNPGLEDPVTAVRPWDEAVEQENPVRRRMPERGKKKTGNRQPATLPSTYTNFKAIEEFDEGFG